MADKPATPTAIKRSVSSGRKMSRSTSTMMKLQSSGRLSAASSASSASAEVESLLETIPISEWRGRMLKSNPDALETRECLRPLSGETSFARMFVTSTTDARVLTHGGVLQMIASFLQANGMKESIAKLEEEAGFAIKSRPRDGEAMEYLLQTVLSDPNTMFSTTGEDDMNASAEDSEVHQFDYQAPLLSQDQATDASKLVNIWEEETSEDTLVMRSDRKSVLSATSNKLIEFVTSDRLVDLRMRDVFLSTFQIYCTPEELWDKLMERYEVPEEIAESAENPELAVKKIRLHIVRLIKAWITTQPKDFSDVLIQRIQNFTDVILVEDGHRDLAKTLRKTVADRVPKNLFFPSLKFMDIPPEEIARQITLLDFQRYSAIKHAELMGRRWNDPKFAHASNVMQMIMRFNQTTRWVVSRVLSVLNYRQRAEIVSFYVQIAERLEKMQSFNSMFAIILGLSHGSIHRLRHTFSALKPDVKATYNRLSDFCSPANVGFQAYLTHYHTLKPPMIPFFGAHLANILFLQENFPDRIGRRINYEKLTMMHEAVSKVLKSKSFRYQFLSVMQVSKYVNKFSHLMAEEEMYRKSFVVEPMGISATQLETLHPAA